MNESNRQKKIAGILQNDLAILFQKMLRSAGRANIMVSVTKVHVTTDLSVAKVYLSVFPPQHAVAMVQEIVAKRATIKYDMAQLVKHQLRKMPDLSFFNDDSLEYIETIDKAIKGTEDPLKDPDLLDKRKKT
jgi:ribosome-binding factor A